ncbi:hypothetical protein EC991_002863 [Linnemannia zychae]|nr:hypothetical protein EC991_002863 [Linnemannia zychae]
MESRYMTLYLKTVLYAPDYNDGQQPFSSANYESYFGLQEMLKMDAMPFTLIPKPELKNLQRKSIGIDDGNFTKIFPRHHVEFLDTLKRDKRCSEEHEGQSSKKMKASDLQTINE